MAQSASEGRDGNGAGNEAGESEGGNDGECDIKSGVVMAGGISGVCTVIHLSVDVLGAMLLLAGVAGIRSEHVEVLPPSSWRIPRCLATTADPLLTCVPLALESVLARFRG
jgi:hypothetical protein